MPAPYVNPEDMKIQLANGNSLIFFHTGDGSAIKSDLQGKYGIINYQKPGGTISTPLIIGKVAVAQ
jgi:hypothetical protein